MFLFILFQYTLKPEEWQPKTARGSIDACGEIRMPIFFHPLIGTERAGVTFLNYENTTIFSSILELLSRILYNQY